MEPLLFSCYCLFDECCISDYKGESFKELGDRLNKHKNKICWLIREFESGARPEKRYAICLKHMEKSIKINKLKYSQKTALSNVCLKRQAADGNSYRL